MECSNKAKKIQSMKKYKRVHQFLYNLVLYSLTSLITLLFFSYPIWFPSMENLLFSVSNSMSFFFNAKSFFILGNIIVFILVGESKLTRSPRSSIASEIYDEYVARSQRTRDIIKFNDVINILEKNKEEGTMQIIEERKVEKKMKIKRMTVSKSMLNLSHQMKESANCKSKEKHVEKKVGLRASKSEVWGESEIMKSKSSKGKKEEQLSIPTEELNTRVEAFIARINKQRLLETISLHHNIYRG